MKVPYKAFSQTRMVPLVTYTDGELDEEAGPPTADLKERERMMNKRIKKKWLAALRSGEYAKGQDTMCAVNINDHNETFEKPASYIEKRL